MIKPPLKQRAEVINRIKGWIDCGDLSPGSQMPTERELCVRLGTQRLTIRRALASLEEEGVVRRIGPRTRVIAERVSSIDNSIVLINAMDHLGFIARSHMPGWVVRMSQGIMSAVSDSHFNLLLIHPERLADGDLEKLVKGRPHGVIFPEHTFGYPRLDLWLMRLKESGIPVAVYGDDPSFSEYDRVASNHVTGGYQLTRHLISLGCRRPLMFFRVDNPDRYWVRQRRQGYEQAMHEAGLEPLPFANYPDAPFAPLVGSDENTQRQMLDAKRRYVESYLRDTLRDLSGKTCDALIMTSDGQIFPVAGACRSMGIWPGSDVLLAGYDNYWKECWEYRIEPIAPIATVDKQNEEAGRLMVQMVHDRAAGRFTEPAHKLVIEPTLVTHPADTLTPASTAVLSD